MKVLKNPVLIVFLMCLFVTACGRPSASQTAASQVVSMSRNHAGIIGGELVEKDSLRFGDKILYLALGVKQSNERQVSWDGHCTASAIASRIVLTAAHCVADRKADELEIVITKNPSLSPYDPNDWFAAADVRIHESYTGAPRYLNDLALILLKRDLPSSKLLKLGSEEQITVPMEMLAVGYGTSSESRDEKEKAQKSSVLNFVKKYVTSIDAAEKTFSINQNDHKGFCSGDSGGPGLIYDSKTGDYEIVGVVSNVSMLDEKRRMMDPDGRYSLCIGQGNYTNVLNPELRRWIESTQSQLVAGK